ncbi:WXG100 family type VII secretion target [Streptomyces profundus]|uniref:WXG100 family type VII secretion target n=1 Tax=Streptomyces profundus TaxID=2867410 RepID=UPI001D15ECD7|nr:WXG100 family type VII secretion target [Streptomyces sp. MA3_2.13]UED84473.1 WXG100 family type VII secretion target [Streptomyces sp. MA3_2.13]
MTYPLSPGPLGANPDLALDLLTGDRRSAEFPTLGFVPCPGDADAADGLANEVRAVATKLGDTLAEMNGSAFQQRWEGGAADAFSEGWGQLRPKLETLHHSLDRAADTLQEWAGYMPGRQSEARGLEQRARAAQDAHDALPAPPGGGGITGALVRVRMTESERRDEERREQLDGQLREIRQQALTLALAYIARGQDIAERLRSGLDDISEGGLLCRVWRAQEQAVGMRLDAVRGWIVGNADRIKNVGDVLALDSTAMGTAAELPFVPGPAKKALGAGGAVLGLGALVTHGTAKLAGADVSWRSLGQDAVGAAGLGSLVSTYRSVSTTVTAVGRVGTTDSVVTTAQDPSAPHYLKPQGKGQWATALTGNHMLVAWENAWRAGGKKR